MPKGADLHSHLSGAGNSEWWYDAVIKHGYTVPDKVGWLNKMSFRYNLSPLLRVPALQAEIVYRNMLAYAEENVSYAEIIVSPNDKLIRVLQNRLEKQDALDTGVEIRFLMSVHRNKPTVYSTLDKACKLVNTYESCVGVSLVAQEKDFPPTMFSPIDVPFAVHAGEMIEANSNVKDSLAIGADRIGHGLNLIHDKETMSTIDKPVEVSLISNKKLGYITEYNQHPLPKYIEAGVPLVMMTDNRGLYRSTLTDEYFIAATELNTSLQDIQTMCRNSLVYSFADSETKQRLLHKFDNDVELYNKAL